ncbi:abortive infection family protein [Flavihumibacter stibioxidans]|uniref:Abortive infection protein-like C-terminal domain-containing protein n=1 Tax=Flavihumibacter stibioxidans TaxID=1834163 RepID=A0ABR7M8D6_9BACT|nr:abortive infection family protein [Flavihumibacter stibioxidans]MBC6491281.1 hypothetical protein [Flavihumibacter stibioxidans]
MKPLISPLYLYRLIQEVKEKLFDSFGSYDNVRMYLERWHDSNGWNYQNFQLFNRDDGKIDVLKTLNGMEGELLLKIAVDLGVATPDYIPMVATFRNEIKSSYKTAYQTFEKAMRDVEEHPNIAVGLVNSALESIIKEICKDDRLKVVADERNTLYDLAQNLLKALGIYPNNSLPEEVRNIASGLLKIAHQIEKLRSSKTYFHGKADDDKIVNDPLLAYFTVNSVTTVGVFLINFYKAKFPPPMGNQNNINPDELPF